MGHWARECRSNVSASSAKEPSSSASKPAMSADLVECSTLDGEISFVGTAQVVSVMSAGLISSPGWGVIDTGCGRTLIGSQTLEELNQKLVSLGKSAAQEYAATFPFWEWSGRDLSESCQNSSGNQRNPRLD